MRIDPANIPTRQNTAPAPAPQQTPPTEEPTRPGPSPRGKAHGVVRKLGTDHFSPTAEAKLSAHFGHLIPTPEPDPVETPDPTPAEEPAEPVVGELPDETDPTDSTTPAPVAGDSPTIPPAEGADDLSLIETIQAIAEAADAEEDEDSEQGESSTTIQSQAAPIIADFAYTPDGSTLVSNLIGQTVDLLG